MTEDARTLPVTVTLTPPLYPSGEEAATSLRQHIEAELSHLLRDLGVPRRPDVDFRESDTQPATPLISLSVDGRPCRFPATMIPEAFAYVEGTPQITKDVAAQLDRLRDSGGPGSERLAELTACVCRAAVSAQPGILLVPADDAALHAAVSLGMSIDDGDHAAPEPAGEDPAERLIAARAGKTIDVHVDPAYLQVLTMQDKTQELFQFMRDGLFTELGLPLPPFHLRPDPSLRPGAFAFRINSVRTLPQVGLPAGTILVNDTPQRLALVNVEARPTVNPSTHQPGALVDQEHKDALEEQGLTTWDAGGFLILSFAAAVRRTAYTMMTRDVAANMTRVLESAFPFLGEATRAHVPPDALAPVLRELLLDGVSVRNLRRIVELLLRLETAGAAGPFPDRIAFVRSGLADLIAYKFARSTATLVAYLIAPEIEAAVAEYGDGYGDGPDPADGDKPLAERLSLALREELSTLPETAQVPVLLTHDEIRRPLRALLRDEFPQMVVVAYGDLPPSFNIQPIARIAWA
jgi:type III secretory pathway component EscV